VRRWSIILHANLQSGSRSIAWVPSDMAHCAHGCNVGSDDETVLATLDDGFLGGVGDGNHSETRGKGNVSAIT
jgi:hypothetical protein